MNTQDFWKNFKLCEELNISGRFIYNGLRCFHEMQTLYHFDEIFDTLYNLSVGIERLLKIAIIMSEHDDQVSQTEFEKGLITHSHQALATRLTKTRDIKFKPAQNDILALLGTFYKTYRYDRYVLATTTDSTKEKAALCRFFEKHLSLQLTDESDFSVQRNTAQLKRFLGRTVGNLCEQLYTVIHEEASRHNIFTYEIRNDSRASKIFIHRQYDFTEEEALWRELIVYLVNTSDENSTLNYLRKIPPLDFDPGLIQDYFECFMSPDRMLNCIDELKELYANLDSFKQRHDEISLLGTPYAFNDGEDDEEGDTDLEEAFNA
ncbi:hypothetical protein EC9_07400 [Rosistilla ulvae]|uniref:Uncharacterized protein n=1 Tax=Rosistilla ulvae TaxID=1930277 RepID=A0A517LVC1_9BACT|nr:hypothetical protein [Rosistilla ulvae]QDS86573.1 hypothetical protein EC9_07400 [Rosistilla ulvae]